RDAVVCGRPQRGDAHEVIAIAEERDRDPARPLKRERGADRDAGARTDAGAAITAEVVERMAKIPRLARPTGRQAREADIDAVGGLVQRVRDRPKRQRLLRARGSWRACGGHGAALSRAARLEQQ